MTKKPITIEKKIYDSLEEHAFDYLNNEFGWNTEHIKRNEHNFKVMVQRLFPNSIVHIIDTPDIWIETQTGAVISSGDKECDIPTSKFLETQYILMRKSKETPINAKYVYIYSIDSVSVKTDPNDKERLKIQLATYNPPQKRTVTFTIDDGLYEKFQKLSDKMAINKSKFVENKIKDFVEKNENA